MYYTLYKTTNKINGMIYIGVHKTSDLDDGYMGSGKYLKRAINKYGVENFTKEILEIFENSEEMFDRESVIVDEDFVKDNNTYNLKVGGFGGWDFNNDKYDVMVDRNIKASKMGVRKLKELYSDKESTWYYMLREKSSKSAQNQIDKGEDGFAKSALGSNKTFSGKHHTEESITQMKETHKKNKHAQGIKNSQYGSMWIYSLELKENKKVPKGDIPFGWLKGRKMKF